jgi:type III restriction enzyme
MDIASRIPWEEVDLKPVLSLTLSMYDSKDVEIGVTLTDDKYRTVQTKGIRRLEEGGIRVDPVFMTRQICDIVPNPWQAHEFSKQVLTHFRENGDDRELNERLIANNFVFLIEELRKQLGCEKDRLAEQVFRSMLKSDELRFFIIGNNFDWTLPKSLGVKASARTLNRKDGTPLQLSLFTFTPEEEFNDTEKAVAWYLENQSRLFFWFRNRARRDYCIQGWRQHRIYPDFIFTSATKDEPADYERVYVVETKGLHLKGNPKTDYVRKIFDLCTKQAKSRKWNQLGPAMKDKILRFEVLSEDEWEAKLNAILLE